MFLGGGAELHAAILSQRSRLKKAPSAAAAASTDVAAEAGLVKNGVGSEARSSIGSDQGSALERARFAGSGGGGGMQDALRNGLQRVLQRNHQLASGASGDDEEAGGGATGTVAFMKALQARRDKI